MLFSSSVFLFLFLPVVLFIYYGLLKWNRTLQNIFLFFASILFYAYGEPKFVLIMLLSIIINWGLGLLVDRFRENKYVARFIIVITLLANLSIIFIFKYLMFAGGILNAVLGTDLKIPEIALPIGISFFTFQALSYVIDVHRGHGKAQKNPFYVGLYISFFPQLIAGPIVRYETVAAEIVHRKETLHDFTEGCYRFMTGFSKKVLLSNNLAVVADYAFHLNYDKLSLPMAWLGSICYSLQIFFDFSGYSDMAIGLGKMFGFHFLENFEYPYISKSVSEFWRRWHISLGSFFRDYVYIPLGGSRVSRKRLIVNLSIVWLLTGLWHGANWTFIFWGIYYLVFLTIEKICGLHTEKKTFIKCFYTLLVVNTGWVIFNSSSLSAAFRFLSVMFGKNGLWLDNAFVMYVNEYKIFILAAFLLCVPWKWLLEKFKQKRLIYNISQTVSVIFLMLCFSISVTFIVKGSYNPFIYFNF